MSLIFLLLASVVNADVEIANYKGWSGACFLKNQTTLLVIVPQIGGRIMKYSQNDFGIIWENKDEYGKTYKIDKNVWRNFGGYKTWPSPQKKWNWPPDPYLDMGECKMEIISPFRIKIIGMDSKLSGIRFEKEISLSKTGSKLIISQKMINISTTTVRYGIWDVTQILPNSLVSFELNPNSKMKDKFIYLIKGDIGKDIEIHKNILIFHHRGSTGKIGSDSNCGWIVSANGRCVYIKKFPYFVEGDYPDGGSSVEIFCCKEYIEVEVLSPVVRLKPAETYSFPEEWWIYVHHKKIDAKKEFLKVIRKLKKKIL